MDGNETAADGEGGLGMTAAAGAGAGAGTATGANTAGSSPGVVETVEDNPGTGAGAGVGEGGGTTTAFLGSSTPGILTAAATASSSMTCSRVVEEERG